jgi:hypothetical protein
LDGGENLEGCGNAKKADKAKRGKKTQTIMDTMWDDLDQQTAEVMIEGAKTLAMNGVEGWWRRCSRRHPGTDRREPVCATTTPIRNSRRLFCSTRSVRRREA